MCLIVQEKVGSENEITKLNSFTVGLASRMYKGSEQGGERKKGVTIGHRKRSSNVIEARRELSFLQPTVRPPKKPLLRKRERDHRMTFGFV